MIPSTAIGLRVPFSLDDMNIFLQKNLHKSKETECINKNDDQTEDIVSSKAYQIRDDCLKAFQIEHQLKSTD